MNLFGNVGSAVGGLGSMFRPVKSAATAPKPTYKKQPVAQKVGSSVKNLGNIGQKTVGNVSANVGKGYSGSSSSGGGSGGGTYSSPPSYSSGGSSYSSGGGGVSGGSGGGGSDFGGASGLSAAAPVQQTITIPDPEIDPVYQKQITELARNMADFSAQQDLAKGQYRGQYNQGLHRLGWGGGGFDDPTKGKWDRNQSGPNQYGDSVNANENDFAGRGVYNSGMYLKSNSDLNNDFNDRKTTMDTSRTDWLNTQGLNRRNLESQQNTTRTSALQDAVSRIAAQYGVNLSDVTPGRQSQVMR